MSSSRTIPVIHHIRAYSGINLRPREVDETVLVDGSATELAERYATHRRFEKLVAKFEDRDQSVTFDALYERVLEDVIREEHKQLYHGSDSVDMGEFRSAVAARTREFLDDYDGSSPV